MHVLLIEDDLDLGSALQKSLKAAGFSSEWLRRSADAPQHPADLDYACVLLDLSLPDGSGFDLLNTWRKQGATVPIIILTARATLEERLHGLDSGADDFIVKPFATAELLSRLRAVLRRYAQQASETWQIGPLQIEPKRHRLCLAGAEIELSPREFQILLELAREPGAVVSKGELAQRLEPLGEPLTFSAIEVHICNLRNKIGAGHIRTIRGVGYLLQA
ncbi:response regulator transcription factor [Chitinimonas sp. JJ19]|uniref:response regulator transcription factor n=1 Tax=Chitinimonas sp. JJ19 TaxID=3109352 RepID=UPI0030019126